LKPEEIEMEREQLFEDSFPELKGKAGRYVGSVEGYHEFDIQQHCLSKQRVKEAFNNLMKNLADKKADCLITFEEEAGL